MSGSEIDFDSIDKDEIRDFLDNKAAIHVITAIGEGNQLFKDISGYVTVSSSTLSNRLKEAKELGIIQKELIETKSGEDVKAGYALTAVGERIYSLIEQKNLPELLEKQREIDREVEEKMERVKAWDSKDLQEVSND